MYVETLLGYVDTAVGEPSMEVQVVDLERGFGESVPMYVFGLILPISDGIPNCGPKGCFVGTEAALNATEDHNQ